MSQLHYTRADYIVSQLEPKLSNAKTQLDMNEQSGVIYDSWDQLLNDVYQHLKTTLPESEYKELQNDEIEWIKEKEKAIKEAGMIFEGGSAEKMEKNMTGIQYTRERCYYLISLIN